MQKQIIVGTEMVHPLLPGTTMYLIDSNSIPGSGLSQRVLVMVAPGATIPLHLHEVDAEMLIVGGSAQLLTDDAENGRDVLPGTKINWPAHALHGFTAGQDGLRFVSTNGGIVNQDPAQWDIHLA